MTGPSPFGTTLPPQGLIEPGNIDIWNRPIARNPDGSISTVRSISVTDDNGRAILIPTVVNGAVVSNEDAINHWQKTNQHLGVFANEDSANKYADVLHRQQDSQYGDQLRRKTVDALLAAMNKKPSRAPSLLGQLG